MKLKNNQSGIAHIGAILAVVIIVVIGVIGWKVWDTNQNKQDSTTPSSATPNTKKQEAEAPKLPAGYAKHKIGDTGLSLVYPSSWGEAKQIPEEKGGGYDVYGMTLVIEKDTSVKIGKSFNAPSYCTYNATTKTWDKGGEYPPTSCEPSVLKVSAIKADGFSKGALGAYGFNYGINLKGDNYLVIGDAILADGTPEKDPETYPSKADSDKLKADLDKNVEIILTNNQTLFE